MVKVLRIVLAQLNFLVGDIEGNARKIIQTIQKAYHSYHANLVVFPELALTGYPPEDLLQCPDLYKRIHTVLPTIFQEANYTDVVLGYPIKENNGCYNRAVWLHNQQLVGYYDKQKLPNYGVFDEARYFNSGLPKSSCIDINGFKIALLICEDLWHPEPMAQAVQTGANLILSLNASPFSGQKIARREQVIQKRIQESHLPLLYLNCVGGQDELVFDGGSMVWDNKANKIQQAPFFEENLMVVTIEKKAHQPLYIRATKMPQHPLLSQDAAIYQALVLGLRDYVKKNHFSTALLGLSGGIDSALTLAIAVDALGKEAVQAVMMPSQYNAEISLIDAKLQAEQLGVQYHVLSIEPIFQTCLNTLAALFKELPVDITEENLQARCRSLLLMALANKQKAIVLVTSNKSELAIGYTTLYGDMAGGFCVLKDVFKTKVYQLARYRNQLSASPVIPERVITRPPSAELKPNQQDQDTLPDYALLDAILTRYIEQQQSIHTIKEAGFDETIIASIISLIHKNEYKRRQAPPGTRISDLAFGKDRRYPLTSGFNLPLN